VYKLLLKSVLQFVVSSLLVILVFYFWFQGGSMGEIIAEILLKVPLAVVAGIVIGDVDLYTRRRFNLLAIALCAALCICGIMGALYIADFQWELNGLLVKIVIVVVSLIIVEVPAIIGYNLMSGQSGKSG